MKNVAIIGSGISGLSAGQILNEKGYFVTIFDKNSAPGGLIRCTLENGNLFHRVGGHVFNTKIEEVKNWFLQYFDYETEFVQSKRTASILMNNYFVNYPIENYLYQLPVEMASKIIHELYEISRKEPVVADNFEQFLINNFGETLYIEYFKPYNEKIWNHDLSKLPLPWLNGKLPMPKIEEILRSNILRLENDSMVHSNFFYPNRNGSSFIAEKLANGLNIKFNYLVDKIIFENNKWVIHDSVFDAIIFTGDVRLLQKVLVNVDQSILNSAINLSNLRSNGTSNVLCYVDDTDLSWLYLRDTNLKCHRIIYTGNFSKNNNSSHKKTCTVEFSGKVEENEMRNYLSRLPGNLIPIAFNYEKNSYVIQEHDTREKIVDLKSKLAPINFYLVGRFAEWEYHNMDMAIYSSMKVCENF